jgi:hypothetical protein
MGPVSAISSALRSATVVAAGAIAVHQLRYLVGYGGDASGALHDQGHGYLDALVPLLALLGGLTLVATIVAAIAGAPPRSRRGAPLVRALVYAGAILAVFGAQETIEGVLVAGHPGGIAAVMAHGGLVALPLALAFGWVVWAALRGLEALDEHVRASNTSLRRPGRTPRLRPVLRTFPPAAVIAGAAGPRAPPSA